MLSVPVSRQGRERRESYVGGNRTDGLQVLVLRDRTVARPIRAGERVRLANVHVSRIVICVDERHGARDSSGIFVPSYTFAGRISVTRTMSKTSDGRREGWPGSVAERQALLGGFVQASNSAVRETKINCLIAAPIELNA